MRSGTSGQERDSNDSAFAENPSRVVIVAGDNTTVTNGALGVSVVGEDSVAKSGVSGAAIGGDRARVAAAKDCVAMAGLSGAADVGDSGMARASIHGFALARWNSVAMVDHYAWAISQRRGFAIARIGLAEARENGVAAAHAMPAVEGFVGGIAIAAGAGMAIALEEGAVVRAGSGGALVGFWTSPDGVTQLEISRVSAQDKCRPDTFYRFEAGKFEGLTDAERLEIENKIDTWTRPWRNYEDAILQDAT